MANHWVAVVDCTGSAPCKPLQVLCGCKGVFIPLEAALTSCDVRGGHWRARTESRFPTGDERPRQPLLIPIVPGDTPNLEQGQRPIRQIKAPKSVPPCPSSPHPHFQFSHLKLDTRVFPLIAVCLFYVHRTCSQANHHDGASLEAHDHFFLAGFKKILKK